MTFRTFLEVAELAWSIGAALGYATVKHAPELHAWLHDAFWSLI